MLQNRVDVELAVSKSIVTILKMFLTKHVAMEYVAIKPVAGKQVMTATTFCECVQCK